MILLIMPVFLSGCASFNNCGPLRGDPSAFNLCLAKKGYKDKQYDVGIDAFNAGDTNVAIKWLTKAAKETRVYPVNFLGPTNTKPPTVTPGIFGAQKLLYEIYSDGLGVEADKKKAEKYYKMMGN